MNVICLSQILLSSRTRSVTVNCGREQVRRASNWAKRSILIDRKVDVSLCTDVVHPVTGFACFSTCLHSIARHTSHHFQQTTDHRKTHLPAVSELMDWRPLARRCLRRRRRQSSEKLCGKLSLTSPSLCQLVSVRQNRIIIAIAMRLFA